MLRSFRVANHKSFRDEAELLLTPVYDKSRPVVPVAAIFGANASGKSNLLDALSWMRMAVRTSFGWEPGTRVPCHPFRLEAADDPAGYEVEVIINGVRHLYGFQVNPAAVVSEWLYAYPRNRKRVILERDDQTMAFGSTVPASRARSRLMSRMTRENVLALSVAAHSNVPDVMDLYQWFRTGLLEFRTELSAVVDRLLNHLDKDSSTRSTLVGLARLADPGIHDIIVSDVPESWVESKADRLSNAERRLRGLDFVHESGAVLRIDEQSAGTVAWLELAAVTLDALASGAALLVDELDQSLHSRLAAGFLELFRDADSNPHGAQLLFTTHDATLLSPVLVDEALRRDEIWFTDKGPNGATRLYPLSGFRPRKHENWERRYLTGSYGAVPMVDELQLHAPVEEFIRRELRRAAG